MNMDNSTKLYLKSLIGAIYKILPMFENKEQSLDEYLDSLMVQLLGGLENFEELKTNVKYLSILNVIQYFRSNELDLKTCKREVFKCTNILKSITQ